MLTSPARLCRPCCLAGPAHAAATAGFSIQLGEIPRETDCPLEGDGFELLVPPGTNSRLRAPYSFRATSPTEREIPERDRLAGGAVWIQTCGSAILVILRKTGLCETDQCTTEQGLGRILSSRPPVDSNSVTSGPAEVDPVLRAPLSQSRLLGFVREIVPPFEGAPPHQQILISALSTSSAEDVANFVVVVGQELTREIQAQRLAEIELSLIRN